MKRVFSSWNLAAAHHARNLLEVEGIRSVLRNEMLSSAMGELPPAECQVEVWVLRDHDAGRAEQVLRKPPAAEAPWTCPACGEAAEAQSRNAGAAGPTAPD